MIQEKKQIYENLLERYEKLFGQSRKTGRQLSMLRLAIFLAGIVFLYIFASSGSSTGVVFSSVITVFLFIFIVKYHSQVISKKRLYEAFIKVNEDELKALDGITSQFKSGMEFNNPDHPFINDIDIFGKHSIFQFLDRSATYPGYKQLADWLLNPEMNSKTILNRQEAVADLKEKLEWRQRFRAIGLTLDDDGSGKQRITDWIKQPALFQNAVFKILIYLIPLLTVLLTIFLSLGYISFQIYFTYLLIPWGIAGSMSARTNMRHNMVSKTSDVLNKYALLLKEIEGLEAKSSLINSLKEKLIDEQQSACQSIKKLSKILNSLDHRLNMIAWAVLNGLFLWDILHMLRLENWQKRHKESVEKWFNVIAETDALNSLANYYFNNDDYIFPEILSGEFLMEAVNLGHPLINRKQLVGNEVNIKTGEFVIITGANMAGKSTYLRTVGVNLILAMIGAPVCADSYRFRPIPLFTSIRTSDSLTENESYFYAELKRLKRIIDEIKSGKEIFIILDEILKGTNSKDKHTGSEALLKQLIQHKATGIIATHDVALGILEKAFPENIKNRCFEVDISNDKLTFDYKLHTGVSQNMNATILMRQMGITV